MEADDRHQLELLSQHRLVGIGEGKVQVNVQVEHAVKPSLAWQEDPGQLDQRQQPFSDLRLGLAVEPLQGEDRVENDHVAGARLELAALNAAKIGHGRPY